MVGKLKAKGFTVETICSILEVSRSGYYFWKCRPESKQKQSDKELLVLMQEIHTMSRGTYGSPRMTAQLKSEGFICSKNRVARLMRIAGLSGVTKQRYRVKTTNSNHDHPIAERLFQVENKSTQPDRPNEIWASDISYIDTQEGWLYLATYLDIYTRKIVGYAMNEHMRTELVLSALNQALAQQKVQGNKLMNHSDRGVQYASDAMRGHLQVLGITASMSRKGNCYDNAYAESFFHTLKTELVYRRKFKTRQEARLAIFEFY